MRIREKKLASFVPWGPSGIHVASVANSRFATNSANVSGLLLANHTGTSAVPSLSLAFHDVTVA